MEQKELFVSIVNTLIEKYCEKYPDEFCFDDHAIGITENGNVLDANGDDPRDTLEWVLEEIVPDLA